LKIVSVSNPMIGRQFDPYMRAVVVGSEINDSGIKEYELRGQDPLKVDQSEMPKETWEVWQKVLPN
jgi:hypothetical protein